MTVEPSWSLGVALLAGVWLSYREYMRRQRQHLTPMYRSPASQGGEEAGDRDIQNEASE